MCFIKSFLYVCCFCCLLLFFKFLTPSCRYISMKCVVMINFPAATFEIYLSVSVCVCAIESVCTPISVRAIVCLNVFNKHHFNPERWCRKEERKNEWDEKNTEKERKHISFNAFYAQKRFSERHFNGWSFRSFTNCVNFVIERACARARTSAISFLYWRLPSLHIYYLRCWE